MNSSDHVTVRVLCDSLAEANQEAVSLRQHLQDVGPEVTAVDIAKESDFTQDLGTSIVIGLAGSASFVALANGIADWLRKRRIGSKVELEINGERVKAEGEIADNLEKVEKLVAAMKKRSSGTQGA